MPLPQPRTTASTRRATARLWAWASSAIAIVFAVAAPITTAQASTIAVRPVGGRAYFVYQTTPGATITGRIRVTNAGATSAHVRLYGVDAVTGPTTGASYITEVGRARAVGSWIRISTPSLTLRPHESRTIPFEVRVPRGARAGDQLGGITADPGVRKGPGVKRGKSTFRVNVRTVTVIAVQLRLPGKREPRMGISGVSAGGLRGYQQLFLQLSNLGNTLIKGRGSITVHRSDGRTVKRMRYPIDTFVPRTAVKDPVLVPGKALPAGTYTGTVTVRYAHRTLTRSFRFKIGAKELGQVYGSPPPARPPLGRSWLALIIAAVAVLLIAIVAAWRLSRRRALRIARAELAAARDRERELGELGMWTPSVVDEHFEGVADKARRDDEGAHA